MIEWKRIEGQSLESGRSLYVNGEYKGFMYRIRGNLIMTLYKGRQAINVHMMTPDRDKAEKQIERRFNK